jgi:arsenate reductase
MPHVLALLQALCSASAIFMARALGNAGWRSGLMPDRPFNVLFLCTGNSARSILAESLMNHWGKDRIRAYSAGSHPTGVVHPIALALLKQMKFPTEGLRSKAWEEFAKPGALPIDFVITVCDNAAGEMCPIWPGQPTKAHWGIPDPASVEGSDTEKWMAFRDAFRALENRIKLFLNLPLASLNHTNLKKRVDAIGKTSEAG